MGEIKLQLEFQKLHEFKGNFHKNPYTVKHDFTGMHELNGHCAYDDFFRKTHARLY